MVKKNSGVLTLVGILVFGLSIVFIAGMISKRDSQNPKKQIAKQKIQWEYCWSDPESTQSRCGRVTKLRIEGGEVLMFRVYWTTTGVTTDYGKNPLEKIGTYKQPGEIGTWFLEKTNNANKYVGWEKDDKEKKVINTFEKFKIN